MSQPSALLLTGAGRYADPWHPFAETSAALAEILRESNVSVTIEDDVDAALATLQDPRSWPDLLAVNVGLPRDGGTSPGTAAAAHGLEAWCAGGRPILAVHSSSTSFVDSPIWEQSLGGRWVRGTTMHPEYGPARVLVDTESGLLVEGLHDFTVQDERYSWLRADPSVRVHARHEHDGELHPLVWSHQRGNARTFYDALGHSAASYSSPERRELLRRGIAWLLEAYAGDYRRPSI